MYIYICIYICIYIYIHICIVIFKIIDNILLLHCIFIHDIDYFIIIYYDITNKYTLYVKLYNVNLFKIHNLMILMQF